MAMAMEMALMLMQAASISRNCGVCRLVKWSVGVCRVGKRHGKLWWPNFPDRN